MSAIPLRDEKTGWMLTERPDGFLEIQAIAGGRLTSAFAAFAAAKEQAANATTGDLARQAIALHGTPTAHTAAARRGKGLADDIAAHMRRVDGDADGDGARPPDGDDWDDLVNLLAKVEDLVAKLVDAKDETQDVARIEAVAFIKARSAAKDASNPEDRAATFG